MRIDHISESHPTLNATKKKAQKKAQKAKNCLEKKVKRFAVAAP
jgi:hypothetical protein